MLRRRLHEKPHLAPQKLPPLRKFCQPSTGDGTIVLHAREMLRDLDHNCDRQSNKLGRSTGGTNRSGFDADLSGRRRFQVQEITGQDECRAKNGKSIQPLRIKQPTGRG